jgi:hypothetical protein
MSHPAAFCLCGKILARNSRKIVRWLKREEKITKNSLLAKGKEEKNIDRFIFHVVCPVHIIFLSSPAFFAFRMMELSIGEHKLSRENTAIIVMLY